MTAIRKESVCFVIIFEGKALDQTSFRKTMLMLSTYPRTFCTLTS